MPSGVITRKQKNIVKLAMVDNISTKKQLLAKAGYSEAMQKTPSKVFESEGVRRLIAQSEAIEGLDDTSVMLVIKRAIQDRDYKNGANVALKWLQLKYNTKANFTDNRSVTINNPDMDKVDLQAHTYIANKYNISIAGLQKAIEQYKRKIK